MTCFWRIAMVPAIAWLAGCATDALRSAPQRPDLPWQPNVSSTGELLPGRASGDKDTAASTYILPVNADIAPRPPASQIDAGHAYGLAELIDIAESSNPKTRQAWDLSRDAALAVGITRAAYLPRLTASVVGGYNYSSNEADNPVLSGGNASLQPINQTINSFSNAGGENTVRNAGSGEVQTLSMEWLLFDFGERDARVAAAQQDQIASNVGFTAAHQAVIYSVAVAFYAHAAACARVEFVQQAYANATLVQKAASARLRRSQGTIQDVAQVNQVVAQDRLRLVQAEGAVDDRYVDLLTAIGISPTTRLTTVNVGGRRLRIEDAQPTDAMIEHAVARRPDVLAAYAWAKAARDNVTAARSAFLPKIFVTGNVTYSTGQLSLNSVPSVDSSTSPTLNLSSKTFSGLILGGITIPIFDGGLRAAALKLAENRVDATDAGLHESTDDAVEQIVTAGNALRTAIEAYSAASALVQASHTSFDAALTVYRSGEGSVTQATIAQSALLDAEIVKSDAYYATLIAAVGLAFADGELGDAASLP
ncbi:TolC family protein [Acidisoma sp.]|uniref:TolC family protein n=1 Tax=Acidisoma sp. TaxID=1872115 RepID=UPI003B0092EB